MNKLIFILLIQIIHIAGYSQIKSDFERYVDKAVEHFNKGEYKNAIPFYDSIIILKPQMEIAYKSRGQSFLNLGEYDAGIQDLERAVTLNPFKVDQYLILAIGYSLNKQEEEAISTLELAIQLDSSNVEVMQTYAGMLFKVGNYEEAKNHYEKLLNIDNEDYDTEYFLGITVGVLGDSITKIKYLESVLSKEIDNYLRLTIYTELERYGDFEILKNEMLKSSDNNTYLKTIIAENYSQRELYKLAIKEYEEIIHLDGPSSSILNSLSWCLIKIGDFKSALKYCNQILEKHKNDYNAFGNRGNAYLKMNKYSLAEIDFRNAINLRPKHPGVYKLLGDLLIKQNKLIEACENYEIAIERNYLNLYKENKFLETMKEHCR